MINYYLLTKPGIIFGNLVTLAAGFMLASKGLFPNYWLFFVTLLGLTFIVASACVLNNYIDKEIDKKMERTKNRALPSGTISEKNALIFAFVLGSLGNCILLAYTNFLTLLAADFGLFVYVVLYSLWKCRTIYGTAIGSIAGAMPPIVGYTAAKGQVDLGTLLLFVLMVFWQMPHFFSIAIYRLEDYKKAKIPVLPVIRGVLRTKIQIVIYLVGFIITLALLTHFHYTGYLYLGVTLCMALTWFLAALQGFKNENEKIFGKKMFYLSLFMITLFCIMIPLESLLIS